MQYPWLTLPHATSQDPEEYLDKQARNNSTDLDQMSFLKEPFDLGPQFASSIPWLGNQICLPYLPSIRTTHLKSLPYWS